MGVKSFTIYEEYFDLISLLEKEEQKDLLLAITEYMFTDKKPTLNDKEMKVFKNLKRPLDKSKNKSKSTSKQNQNEIKLKSNENQNEIKLKTHHDVNVIVNVNVYVLIEYIESNLGITINGGYYLDILNNLFEDYDLETLKHAIDITVASGHKNLNYFLGIVRNWKNENLKSLEEIKANEKRIEKPIEQEDIEALDYDWLNEVEK